MYLSYTCKFVCMYGTLLSFSSEACFFSFFHQYNHHIPTHMQYIYSGTPRNPSLLSPLDKRLGIILSICHYNSPAFYQRHMLLRRWRQASRRGRTFWKKEKTGIRAVMHAEMSLQRKTMSNSSLEQIGACWNIKQSVEIKKWRQQLWYRWSVQ